MGGNITVDREKNKGTMFSFSIWVEIPDDEMDSVKNSLNDFKPAGFKDMSQEEDNMLVYGSVENLEEIRTQLSKIILCVDMDNWEKAENFSESLKQLTSNAPKEIKTAALRLKMAVQKADSDKINAVYEQLKVLIDG